jgi:hypothetical protein
MEPVAVPSRQMLSAALFWALVGLSAAMLVALLLLLGGVVPVESPAGPPAARNESAAGSAASRAATTATAPPPSTTPAAPAAPEPALVVLRATRGDCWFQARLGSKTGRVLDERVLAPGESARFEGHRVWLMVGAAGNVELTVDGRPMPLSSGTVSIVLTPQQTSSPAT